ATGLQPIAAEGALKVGVPFEQRDLHPAAGEQVGEGRASRPGPDDDDTSDRHDATPFGLGTITVPCVVAERASSPADAARQPCRRGPVRWRGRGLAGDVSGSEVSGQRFLKIVYSGGKFTLTASMLPRKEDFDEICAAVGREVKASGLNAR